MQLLQLQRTFTEGFELIETEYFFTNFTSPSFYLFRGFMLIAFFLFTFGLLGMMYNYSNFLVAMMCVEMMYLGIITSFVVYSVTFHDVKAAVYALLTLIFAACESAVGLGLLIVLYRFGHAIDFDTHSELGG